MNSIHELHQIWYRCLIFFLLFFVNVSFVQAFSLPFKFPRLANIFLKPYITEEEARDLSKWDLLVLGMQVQHNNPEIFRIIKERNPDTIILAYVAPAEVPLFRLDEIEDEGGPWHKLVSQIPDQWYLYNSEGYHISFWTGN